MSMRQLAAASLIALASFAAKNALAEHWSGDGVCKYGYRHGGHTWWGQSRCWNDSMCRDGNPDTWERCVERHDGPHHGRCQNGWRHGSQRWWGHGYCERDYECKDGNPDTWDRCVY